MTTIFEIDPIKYERDMLFMLVLDEDEFGPGAFDRAVEKLKQRNTARDACEAMIRYERSSLEDGDDSASFDAEFHFEAKQQGFSDEEIAEAQERFK